MRAWPSSASGRRWARRSRTRATSANGSAPTPGRLPGPLPRPAYSWAGWSSLQRSATKRPTTQRSATCGQGLRSSARPSPRRARPKSRKRRYLAESPSRSSRRLDRSSPDWSLAPWPNPRCINRAGTDTRPKALTGVRPRNRRHVILSAAKDLGSASHSPIWRCFASLSMTEGGSVSLVEPQPFASLPIAEVDPYRQFRFVT